MKKYDISKNIMIIACTLAVLITFIYLLFFLADKKYTQIGGFHSVSDVNYYETSAGCVVSLSEIFYICEYEIVLKNGESCKINAREFAYIQNVLDKLNKDVEFRFESRQDTMFEYIK